MIRHALAISIANGRIIRALAPHGDGASVTDPLGGIPTITGLTVPKTDARDLVPWRDGIAVIDEDDTGSLYVIAAGPITDEPQETRDAATITAAGIEATLAGWLVMGRREIATGDEVKNAADLSYRAASAGTVAWSMIDDTMSRVGRLPIRHASPSEPGDAVRVTVPVWDLRNNGLWQWITKLSDQADMAFIPRTDGDLIWWDYVHGTSAQPALPQQQLPVVDLTTGRGVADVIPTTSWDRHATRVYAAGSGQGAGQLISMAYAQHNRLPGVPPREVVITDTSIPPEDWPRLQAMVDHHAATATRRVVQIDLTLDQHDAAVGIRAWRPGHECIVTAPAGEWRAIPGGNSRWRMISRTIPPAGTAYTVKLQQI